MNSQGPKCGWCCGSCHRISKIFGAPFLINRGRWGTGPGGNGGDRLSKAFTWCCDMFLFLQEQHHTPDCRSLKGPLLESSCSLNSSQQLKWEVGSVTGGSRAACHEGAFRNPLLLHSSGNLVVALAVWRLQLQKLCIIRSVARSFLYNGYFECYSVLPVGQSWCAALFSEVSRRHSTMLHWAQSALLGV